MAAIVALGPNPPSPKPLPNGALLLLGGSGEDMEVNPVMEAGILGVGDDTGPVTGLFLIGKELKGDFEILLPALEAVLKMGVSGRLMIS